MNFPRGYLAGLLAGVVMTAAPSLGQTARVTPVSDKSAKTTLTEPKPADDKPTLLRRAEFYSEDHPVIVIAIAKGQKETKLTGEQIGDKLSEVIMKIHGIPTKYFVEPGGDYTAIAFFVKGHAYGPYGLNESLSGLTLATSGYDERVAPHLAEFPRSGGGFLAKPEPQQ